MSFCDIDYHLKEFDMFMHMTHVVGELNYRWISYEMVKLNYSFKVP